MLRLVLVVTVCLPFVFQSAYAQSPAEKTGTAPPTVSPSVSATVSPGELKVTPEMWFYEQAMRNYQNPKLALRARAEFETAQRQRRLAAMKWYGLSNSRPRWSADIYNWDQSAGWSSNNSVYPYRWQGIGQPWYMSQSPQYNAGRY